MKPGKNQHGHCRCEGCGAAFSSLAAFDLHRSGSFAKRNHSRYCLGAEEMRRKGMTQNARGLWGTGHDFSYTQQQQRSA